MDFDKFYENYDNSIKIDEVETKDKCCDNINNYNYTDGIIMCNQCNCTISKIIDNPEWRYYGSNDSKNNDPTRCGMPVNPLLPGSSIGTSVNCRTHNKVALIQKWNSMPYKEWSKYKVFTEISQVCKENNLPTIIINTSKSLYSNIAAVKISRGNNRKGIIVACVFNACKECGVPRSVRELSIMFNISPRILTKGCKNYTEIIRKNKVNMNRNKSIVGSTNTTLTDFTDRFNNKLNINKEDSIKINQIATLCIEHELIYDNTPPSMAAGCIYLYIKLMNLKINKKLISKNCLISEVTINKCYKKLISEKNFIEKINEILKINKT